MRILVAGGTGFLGTALTARLRGDGHQVTALSRHPRDPRHVRWSPDTGISPSLIADADVVVNLSGAPIAGGRWTVERKAAIRGSRIAATRALAEAIRGARRVPAAFISGSAVGFYGIHGDEPLTEEARPGSDFLASVCRDWESEALTAAGRTRVVLLRTGLVLARHGGALPQLARPFWFFAGGPLGSGTQVMSWVHLEDWVEMVCWAIANAAVTGPLNVAAPNAVTNREMASTLGRVIGRPAVLPMPAAALRLLLGEMADALLLGGQRVLPAKAQALGFRFRHPTLEPALRQIYR